MRASWPFCIHFSRRSASSVVMRTYGRSARNRTCAPWRARHTHGQVRCHVLAPVRVRCPVGLYNEQMARLMISIAASTVISTVALGQTPQPFPRPGSPPQPSASPAQPAPPVSASAPARAADVDAPTEATLGVPLYPTGQFIASFDAGRGQRYYIFGTTAPYAELVTYYRTVLKDRGDEVFEQPPTHIFEVGRFRDETMAFPPSVTIKDWTSGGSAGYPNPRPGAQPARFPTIIMIVPAPPGTGRN